MKRRTVAFASEAVDDLNAIFDWVAESASESVALGFAARIERYCLAFDIASVRGSVIKGAQSGLRFVGFNRQATILFRVENSTVTIVPIFRAGREWRSAGIS